MTTDPDPMGPSTSEGTLNPPSWIHGTWVPCTVIPDSSQILDLAFSATTVVVTESLGMVFDFSTIPGVSDSQGTDWYQIEYQIQGEQESVRFTQDGQRLRGTASGTSDYGHLCRADTHPKGRRKNKCRFLGCG